MNILSLRSIGLAAVATTAFLALAVPVAAEQIVLQGKHSKADIKSHCDAAGGLNIEGAGGKGYGCVNPSKGTMVACHDNGTCTGYTPQKP